MNKFHCFVNFTGGACRSRVTKKLSQQFSSPKAAEACFLQQLESPLLDPHSVSSEQLTQSRCQEASPQVGTSLPYPEPTLATLLSKPYEPSCSLPSTYSSPDESDGVTIQRFANPHVATHSTIESSPSQSSSCTEIRYVDTLQPALSQLRNMDTNQQLSFISEMFTNLAESEQLLVPNDFLQLSMRAMKQLQSSGRSNLLYGLALGVGTKRKDDSDSKFPLKKVVAGLIEYSINFFNAEASQNVSRMSLYMYVHRVDVSEHCELFFLIRYEICGY